MDKEREQHWLSILQMSTNMRELAKKLEWEDLAKLEAQRQNRIKSFFSQPVSIEDADTVRQGIHTILNIDQQIICMGKKHKGEIGGKLVDFHVNKKAVNAYKVNSR